MSEEEKALSKKKMKRLEYRLQVVEKRDRFLRKDRTSNRAVLEEVFDKSTLMILYSLLNHNVVKSVFGVIKAGKESRVYRGEDSEGINVAVKIFLTVAAEFKKMMPYIQGDRRFRFIKKSTRSLIYAWAQKEYKNLLRAHKAGIRVPRPIHVEKNVLIMEFIGEGDIAAPTLREKPPSTKVAARKLYRDLVRGVRDLYQKAGLVHGDLSQYNIMNHGGVPVIFDMAQSMLIDHPKSMELLSRDLKNLNTLFEGYGIKVRKLDRLYKWVTKR